MDIDAIAKKAQERIFARAEEDGCHRGKVMHASAVQEEIARTIREAMPKPSWCGGVVAMGGGASAIEHTLHAAAMNGQGITITYIDESEWR